MNSKAWKFEKAKYVERIKQKEESLRIHIKELDRLNAENKRLVKKLNLADVGDRREMLNDFVVFHDRNTFRNRHIPLGLVDRFLGSI